MFFQGHLFALSYPAFLELLPYLTLTLAFAVAILGAGLKLSPRFFKLLGFVGFTLAALFWTRNLFAPEQAYMGLLSTTITRTVGLVVSLFGLLSFALFDVADRYKDKPEWLALTLLSVLGLCLLPVATDWVSFFVFLETFSIPAYVLVAYDTGRERSLEASVKYMLAGAFASSLLLMGIALVYLTSGSMSYAGISSNLSEGALTTFGILLILSGLLFKLTAVPFHFWAPDVYQGAPTGVAALLAAATKLSVFTAGAIAFSRSGFSYRHDAMVVAIIVGCGSAIIGSFLAYTQRSFRRMMAYSGTVNAGVLVPLMVSGEQNIYSGMFFLFVYGLTLFAILSCFASLMKKRGVDANEDLDIESFSVRDQEKSSVECLIIGTGLISMAGIPPFPGFIAKYWAYSDMWSAGNKVAVSFALAATLLGVAYYIRVAGKFFFGETRKVSAH